jgi:hypothetical protein
VEPRAIHKSSRNCFDVLEKTEGGQAPVGPLGAPLLELPRNYAIGSNSAAMHFGVMKASTPTTHWFEGALQPTAGRINYLLRGTL